MLPHSLLRKFLRYNILSTIYINLKYLPFKQALKCPIIVYGKIRFENLSGNIVFQNSTIKRGMLRIGAQDSDFFPISQSVLYISGNLLIAGDNISLGCGVILRIEKNGNVILHNNIAIGANSMIFCESEIKIGSNTITSWECQIMDTDRHDIIDNNSDCKQNKISKVSIGENCWIGNKVSINKGSVLPDYTIVASSSLCNKDYSLIIKTHSVIGGIPAKLISENKTWIR